MAILPQIKKIVVLTLENRSLDNVLGWLYEKSVPDNVYPENSPREYDGLVAGKYSNPAPSTGRDVEVRPLPDHLWRAGQSVPYTVPFEMLKKSEATWPNPFSPPSWNGVMNQLFGDQNIIPGLPSRASGPPKMQGFLQDYFSPDMIESQGHDVLWTYTPRQLCVINDIARKFAVSDRWFSSVPSQTNPNRAYSICGTSIGRESNQNVLAYEEFDTRTIFNVLAEHGKSWGLYFSEKFLLTGKSYTEHTFPQLSQVRHNAEIADISIFFDKARNGTLPDFTYLEPTWEKNDYHPWLAGIGGDVRIAEDFLKRVFLAVRNGKSWGETLLVITFDEHGGTYDHFPPPWTAENPDGRNGVEDGFKFDLFGVRVPTILVSPFVKPSTVFRAPEDGHPPYDHTSLTATVLKWAGADPVTAGLHRRVAKAQTIEGVFSDQPVNSETLTVEPPRPMALPPTAILERAPSAVAAEMVKTGLAEIPVMAKQAILHSNRSLDGIQADIARYRQDPEKFEAELRHKWRA